MCLRFELGGVDAVYKSIEEVISLHQITKHSLVLVPQIMNPTGKHIDAYTYKVCNSNAVGGLDATVCYEDGGPTVDVQPKKCTTFTWLDGDPTSEWFEG